MHQHHGDCGVPITGTLLELRARRAILNKQSLNPARPVTIKPIRSEADHATALSRLEAIFDAVPGTPEADEAEVISTLIQLYEERHFPIDLPSPVAAIRFRMEQQGMKAKDLIPFIGSASKVSEVLSGRRRLSLAMIRNLIRGLGIPAHILLQVPAGREAAFGAWAPRRAQREPEAMLREDREGPRTQPNLKSEI